MGPFGLTTPTTCRCLGVANSAFTASILTSKSRHGGVPGRKSSTVRSTVLSRELARLNTARSSGRPDRGAVSGLLIGLACVVLGGGAAAVALIAVVTATGPDDSGAVLNGPQQPVSPTEIIRYGG